MDNISLNVNNNQNTINTNVSKKKSRRTRGRTLLYPNESPLSSSAIQTSTVSSSNQLSKNTCNSATNCFIDSGFQKNNSSNNLELLANGENDSKYSFYKKKFRFNN